MLGLTGRVSFFRISGALEYLGLVLVRIDRQGVLFRISGALKYLRLVLVGIDQQGFFFFLGFLVLVGIDGQAPFTKQAHMVLTFQL